MTSLKKLAILTSIIIAVFLVAAGEAARTSMPGGTLTSVSGEAQMFSKPFSTVLLAGESTTLPVEFGDMTVTYVVTNTQESLFDTPVAVKDFSRLVVGVTNTHWPLYGLGLLSLVYILVLAGTAFYHRIYRASTSSVSSQQLV